MQDSERYCPETSNISIVKLTELRQLRKQLDDAIREYGDAYSLGIELSKSLDFIDQKFSELPFEVRKALGSIYSLSALNRFEFGDTIGVMQDLEMCFVFNPPTVEEVEKYLQASIDSDCSLEPFEAIANVFGDIPEIMNIVDCYRICYLMRHSKMDECNITIENLAHRVAKSLEETSETIKQLNEKMKPSQRLNIVCREFDRLGSIYVNNKASKILDGCDKVISEWQELIQIKSNPSRSLRVLKKLSGDRPLFIASMQGRGWLFSHMILQIEWFLRGLDTQGVKNPFVIILNPDRFANDALVQMYRRRIVLIDDRHPRLRRELYGLYEDLKSQNSPIAQPIDRLNSLPHLRDTWTHPERINEIVYGKSVLEFTEEDTKRGHQLLKLLGIPVNAPFACFGVREDTYYKGAWAEKKARAFPWECGLENHKFDEAEDGSLVAEYQNMQSVMKVNLANYTHAIRQCTDNGIYMIRIGTDIEQNLPSGMGERVVDYARVARTDFGDLFLMAHCKFMLSGATGNYTMAMALNRPIVVTDHYLPSLGFPSTAKGIPNVFLPRLYFYKVENRFLTSSETLECARRYQRAENCNSDGVEVIPSTAEDIAATVEEINQRIDGNWKSLPEVEELQKRVLALYKPYHEGYGMNGLVSAAYLMKYRDLIC